MISFQDWWIETPAWVRIILSWMFFLGLIGLYQWCKWTVDAIADAMGVSKRKQRQALARKHWREFE